VLGVSFYDRNADRVGFMIILDSAVGVFSRRMSCTVPNSGFPEMYLNRQNNRPFGMINNGIWCHNALVRELFPKFLGIRASSAIRQCNNHGNHTWVCVLIFDSRGQVTLPFNVTFKNNSSSKFSGEIFVD